MAVAVEPAVAELLVGLDPPVQLGSHLLPPLKREGLPFEQAWELAWDAVCWPESMRECRDWQAQLRGTRTVWQASYEDWPPERAETAIRHLADSAADLAFSEAA